MTLEKLTQQLNDFADIQQQAMPPVEKWDPPFCGDMDLTIKADGQWFYMGTPFKRHRLVKLLASVLKKEGDNYYLVTPVEKIGITVEDAPLMLTEWQWLDDEQLTMQAKTNLDDVFVLDASHPLSISANGNLYVIVRRNITAKVHRNVYYQWVELAEERTTEQGNILAFESAGQLFSLGALE